MLTHLKKPSDPARLLVLGARGFLARELLAHTVSLGWNVRAAGSAEIDLTTPDSVDALASLLSPDTTLVFLSALTPDRGRDISTLMRNLAMGQHVCAALEKQPCSHVIHVGSDAVYHDAVNPVREESSIAPSLFHGVMHFTRERMAVDTCQRLKVPLARLRPSLLYGPGDTHNGYGPNRFVRTACADGRITLFGDGEERRDHVFIADAARLIADVARRRSEGVLNIATGTSRSFREVADLVARIAPRDVRIETSPRANPILHRHFDVTAHIVAFPGFTFSSLEDGLERALAAATCGMTTSHRVAGVILLRPDGAALFQHRDDKPGLSFANKWVPPGGHCEDVESVEACARREFEEETGYRLGRLISLDAFLDTRADGFPPLWLSIFWSRYDGRHPVQCREGQALRFIPREEAGNYQIPEYLVELWDRALAAAAAEVGAVEGG